jgi:hypothetical protein
VTMAKIKRHFSRKKINDAELKRLWPSRLSDEELEKRLGHHKWTLRRRAVKIGLPSSRREIWSES